MNDSTWYKIRDALLVAIFFALILLFVVYQNPDFKFDLNALEDYGGILWDGYVRTLWVSLIALALSLVFSALLFSASISKHRPFNYFYIAFTQIALGVPLMVHIIVLYFFLASALGIKSELLGGILILALYMSAYFAKTLEGAYHAIPTQQFKMMHILQLPRTVSMRKIILPQIIRSTLPTLTSHFSLLVKSTALLSLISVPEFKQTVDIFNSRTLEFVTGYVLLAIGYLTITIPLSLFAHWLNKKVVNA